MELLLRVSCLLWLLSFKALAFIPTLHRSQITDRWASTSLFSEEETAVSNPLESDADAESGDDNGNKRIYGRDRYSAFVGNLPFGKDRVDVTFEKDLLSSFSQLSNRHI